MQSFIATAVSESCFLGFVFVSVSRSKRLIDLARCMCSFIGPSVVLCCALDLNTSCGWANNSTVSRVSRAMGIHKPPHEETDLGSC